MTNAPAIAEHRAAAGRGQPLRRLLGTVYGDRIGRGFSGALAVTRRLAEGAASRSPGRWRGC